MKRLSARSAQTSAAGADGAVLARATPARHVLESSPLSSSSQREGWVGPCCGPPAERAREEKPEGLEQMSKDKTDRRKGKGGKGRSARSPAAKPYVITNVQVLPQGQNP